MQSMTVSSAEELVLIEKQKYIVNSLSFVMILKLVFSQF